MKKQSITTSRERKLKFAEAGILFVLVLALAVFVGVRVATDNDDIVAPAVTVTESVPETVVAAESGAGTIESEIEPIAPAEITAEATTADSLENNPPPLVSYAEAEQTYFTGDFEEAADLFAAYAAEHPANAWGHYMLGLSAWKAGDTGAAEEAFVQALTIKPDHVKSLVNYGRVLLEMERADEAVTRLETALEIDPASVDARRVLGRAYHNLGRLGEAADSYRAALLIRIDDVWSLNNLGLIHIEQGRFAEAVAPLARAAGLKTDAACIQNNLGVALERTGHFQDAVLAYERALVADENYAKADESLTRVNDLADNEAGERVDLAVLAEEFAVKPTADEAAVAAAEPVQDDSTGDMEVAAAGIGDEAADESEDPDKEIPQP